MDTKGQIIKAMAVIRRPRDGALLVSEYTDTSQPRFQRPLGGHVEFGEYARDTIHREFLEELDQRLSEVRLLGVLENIFPWHGGTEHEVVFIFSAAFADPAAYDVDEQPIGDNPERRVLWRPAGAVRPPLYPDGLAELIAASRLPGSPRVAAESGGWDSGAGVWAARRSIRLREGKARRPEIRAAGAQQLLTLARRQTSAATWPRRTTTRRTQ